MSKSATRLSLVGAFVFTVGASYALASSSPVLKGLDRWRAWRAEGVYQPNAPLFDTTEVLMVYIGSSTCGPSNTPGLSEIVERLKLSTQRSAHNRGLAFATMAIARDRNVQAGLEHIAKFGSFDEVASGRGWYNTGLLKYLYEDIPGIAATPQVLILQREVLGDGKRGIGSERVLARKVGLREIRSWEAAGAPLPRMESLDSVTVIADTSRRQ